MSCPICANAADNRVHEAREMMFGLRERFRYLECARCGCLALLDAPADMSPYYPPAYYSLGGAPRALPQPLLVKGKRARTAALLRAPAPVLDALARSGCVPARMIWFAGLGLRSTSAICDVGSGDGEVLTWMLGQGFSNLAGFDPYLDGDLDIGGRVAIRRLGVAEMPGGWDLIMLNHSFEHMAEPASVLAHLQERLRPGGAVLIRVPVADSWAWRTYGADWVQLDAPRHLFLHTRRSLETLAERAGMAIERVFFDSYALQLWGSEQYRRDIPLRDPRSYVEDQGTALFSAAQLREFERRARRLNRQRAGDSAGFVLRARAN
jgi:SAM-dependent methyltransferase